MLDFLTKGLSSLFGSKSSKDIQEVQPLVNAINQQFEQYKSISNDALRTKTIELKERIRNHYQSTEDQIQAINKKMDDDPAMEMTLKNDLYDQVDKLEKERNEKIEEILEELLPEAFAVVKETARRFMENPEIEVTASEMDRDLSAVYDNVNIKGDKAIYKNKWLAAGNEIEWNMMHYDVQLIGGIVLHKGKIAEMATGEGKTLVATLPAYLNALAGKGVHIITVNDYLARRDSEWMAPIFQFHGLNVDCIDKHTPHSEERRKAYLADVTYGTNNEFGFDYLRDNMTRNPEELVQRQLHYAMVDEVDSVLVDDARTPLIISGPIPRGDQHEFYELKPRIQKLVAAQKQMATLAISDAKKQLAEGKRKEAGEALLKAHRGLPKNAPLIKLLSEEGNRALMQKTENFYMQDNSKEMHKIDAFLYFTIDEKNNSIELTEKGIELITESGEDTGFFVMPDVGSEIAEIEKSSLSDEEKMKQKDELMRNFGIKSERLHSVNQLLKAYTLFEKDTEYIIDGGKVKIVDEQTGRIMDGRRYSDGLHQAIEAKENVKVEAATQTYATVTLQNYFRMYHKLAGMTGTALTEAGEFWEIYKLDVVEIPTNVPIERDDRDDFVYKTKREKYNAVIDEIVELTGQGRPVLVGTTSVEISELLSKMLKLRKLNHNVLNAKQHQSEAEIVQAAGKPGTVTIATNMAGRGTDIKLSAESKAAGGLAIVGTERHESRRIDRQLRGRAGRQGDPGTSQFFVSLEDNLMRLFGSDRIAGLMDRMGLKEGEVIQHSMISKSIERAQKKVEENNFGIRKRLLEYDDVMNSQREVIYNKRKNALFGHRLDVDIDNMLYDSCDEVVNTNHSVGDYDGFKLDVLRVFANDIQMSEAEFQKMDAQVLLDKLYTQVRSSYNRKIENIGEFAYPIFKRVFDDRGATVENVVVPFSDGSKQLQVAVNLQQAVDSNGKAVMKAFEKSIVLALIDEAWKDHLREMDDLKQSVQAAVYEQKDPLLIYKFESFELFKKMLANVNRDIISFLFKGNLPQMKTESVQEAAQRKSDLAGVKTRKDDAASSLQGMDGAKTNTNTPKAQPVRVGEKVGRNDPCPCGSGKKFKQCHGKPGHQED